MRALLLGLAPVAVMAFAAPAAALDPPAKFTAASTSSGRASGVTIHHGLPPQFLDGWNGPGRGGDRDRRRRGNDTVLIYDRDFQGDTAWRSESFNDWWHDQPQRSYPRWMANNQGCERLWWSGGGWRC
jgi:hypothetical protein